MAEGGPWDLDSFGEEKVVTKLDEWVKTFIIDNVRLIPKKCRPFLKRALQTGFIEDKPRFEAAFDGLLHVLRNRMIANMRP